MLTPTDLVLRLRAAGCVFAEQEAEILLAAGASPAELESMLERRVAGQPLETIVGWAAFAGLRIAVMPGVFVPRRRTEFLVEQALAVLPAGPSVLVDLCCGSGAVGAAVLAARPEVAVHASDLDPVAVGCARRNLGRPTAYVGDLFEPLPGRLRGTVAVIVANPPHVPTDAIALMPAEARIHEPMVALHGGADGLDLLRRLAASARDWLAPGGQLLVEVGASQVEAATAILAGHGLRARGTRSPALDATVVVAVGG